LRSIYISGEPTTFIFQVASTNQPEYHIPEAKNKTPQISYLFTFPDFIDCDSNKYSAGVVAFVKVELKNGIYHQDVGYGTCSNSCCKGYAIACARKVGRSLQPH